LCARAENNYLPLGHITVDLNDPKNLDRSGKRGSIGFAVVKQVAIAAGSSAVAETRRLAESAGLLVPERGQVLATAAKSIDPLANIVSKLAGLEKVVQEIAKASFNIVSERPCSW
jgi:hypothetical protein